MVENIENQFWIKKFEVTQGDWNKHVGNNQIKGDPVYSLSSKILNEICSSSGYMEGNFSIIGFQGETGKEIFLEEEVTQSFYPNEFIMMVSNQNEKKSAIGKFVNPFTPLRQLNEYKTGLWGVHARNKEQLFALNLLMDPEVKIVSLIGKAGSGKTLISVAAGLQQVVSNPNIVELAKGYHEKNGLYKKLVVSRPVMPMGKDIGFLPGTMEEKMAPWLAPVQDNLKFLTGNDQTTLQQYMDKGVIEMEALTYIRGRSIANAFIVIDEAQNLTHHEIKTILTRVGEGTKIVLTGDIEQIDNPPPLTLGHVGPDQSRQAYSSHQLKIQIRLPLVVGNLQKGLGR